MQKLINTVSINLSVFFFFSHQYRFPDFEVVTSNDLAETLPFRTRIIPKVKTVVCLRPKYGPVVNTDEIISKSKVKRYGWRLFKILPDIFACKITTGLQTIRLSDLNLFIYISCYLLCMKYCFLQSFSYHCPFL